MEGIWPGAFSGHESPQGDGSCKRDLSRQSMVYDV
jgi:hypothetical protein